MSEDPVPFSKQITEEVPPIPDEVPQYMRPQRHFRWWLILGAAVVLTGVGYCHRVTVSRFLESKPPTFAEMDATRVEKWMTETLPHFVIAVSKRDPKVFDQAVEELLAGSEFEDVLHRRAEGLVDALRGFHQHVDLHGVLAKRRDLREYLAAIGQELTWLEADLIEANAPYSLDWQVQTRMHEQRWLLRFLVRTSRILGTTEFTTGSETTKIWRVTRIDNLSLVDLTHGVARNGFGRVYVEQIRGLVANRLLPALSSEGQLRNLFSKPRKELDVIALMFRLYHAETFPKGLRSALPVVAKLAHERRLLLEEVHQTLKRADGGLISPTEFFLSEESHRSIARGMRQLGRADLAARLARFSLATDLDEDTQQKIREVSHFLFEQAVREVERHEAWHILVPEPQRTGEPPWPEEADNEGIAYLGMVADADDEIALCSDTLYRLFLGAKKEEHPSATDTVVYGLWLRMLARDLEVAQAKKESETADTAAAEGKEASSIFSVWKRFLETAKTKYASRKTMCRELLQEWYGESRSLKWIGHTPREIQYMPLGNTRT